jgi:hypothetical protein
MAVTHPTAVRNAIADLVVDRCDAGAAAGKLKLRLSGTAAAPGTAAATLTLSDPAFGAASGGMATASAITSDTNATGNASAVANATLEDSDGNVVCHFAVAASGSDLNLSGGLTIGAGDTVACSSLTYSAPA